MNTFNKFKNFRTIQLIPKRRICTTLQRRRQDENYSKDKVTHFGFSDNVSELEKKKKVLKVFDNVAESYDKMNDAMSFGVHRLWKDKFVETLNPPDDIKLLDVAGGTGDIAFRVLEKLGRGGKGHVTICDINASMLEVGEKRAQLQFPNELQDQLTWTVGDAQKLPFEDNTFDAYTIAFGIRNVVKINQALEEAFRVLKPGGRFLCLEFSQVENALMEQLYTFYSFQVIPPMGKVLAGDWDSYQYLVESIRRFPPQEDFAEMIADAGFSCVNYENLTFGVACIHSGFKL